MKVQIECMLLFNDKDADGTGCFYELYPLKYGNICTPPVDSMIIHSTSTSAYVNHYPPLTSARSNSDALLIKNDMMTIMTCL